MTTTTTTTTTTDPAGRPQPDPATVRTVVCYARTANPGKSGQRQRLLRRQRVRLEAEVTFQGWTVAAWVEDLHQSATTLQRPGLQQALGLLATRKADALLACDRDRLAVHPAVAEQLAALAERQGWQLLTLDRPRRGPAGRAGGAPAGGGAAAATPQGPSPAG